MAIQLDPAFQKRLLRRHLLGKSTIGTAYASINLPRQVVKSYKLGKGDQIEWYPGDISFPDEKFPDIMVLMVKRKKEDIGDNTCVGK